MDRMGTAAISIVCTLVGVGVGGGVTRLATDLNSLMKEADYKKVAEHVIELGGLPEAAVDAALCNRVIALQSNARDAAYLSVNAVDSPKADADPNFKGNSQALTIRCLQGSKDTGWIAP